MQQNKICLLVLVLLTACFFTRIGDICNRLLSDERGTSGRIIETLSKMRYPDERYSMTLAFKELIKNKEQTVRLIARILPLLPNSEKNDWIDVWFLSSILSIMGAKDKNMPDLDLTYFHSDGLIIPNTSALFKCPVVDRKSWSKWALEVPPSNLLSSYPVKSPNELCENIIHPNMFSHSVLNEASNILTKASLSEELLRKLAANFARLPEPPTKHSVDKAYYACKVLASDGKKGQRMLLDLFPNMSEGRRKMATVQLLRFGNRECKKRVFEELEGKKWKVACSQILDAGSDNLITKLFKFVQENARYDILLYLLNEARINDLSPFYEVVLSANLQQDLKQRLLRDFCKKFGIDTIETVPIHKLQIARKPSVADLFGLRITSLLANSVTMKISDINTTTGKVQLEFQNHTNQTIWINISALQHAMEEVKGKSQNKGENWELSGYASNLLWIAPLYEFFPFSNNLLEIKPQDSILTEYTSSILSKKTIEEGTLTITYWNTVDKYFTVEDGSLSLKSDKKIFKGFITARATFP